MRMRAKKTTVGDPNHFNGKVITATAGFGSLGARKEKQLMHAVEARHARRKRPRFWLGHLENQRVSVRTLPRTAPDPSRFLAARKTMQMALP